MENEKNEKSGKGMVLYNMSGGKDVMMIIIFRFINIISDGNLKGNSVMSVLLFQGNQFTGMVYIMAITEVYIYIYAYSSTTLSLYFFAIPYIFHRMKNRKTILIFSNNFSGRWGI